MPPATVRRVWHPVGALPARVYWRRRLLVLTVLLAVLGGGTWLTLTLLDARAADDSATASAAARSSVRVPALERVVPSLANIATPTPPSVAAAAAEAAAAAAATATPTVPAPVAGGPCTDDMIGLEVRSPGTVAVGSKPTFELVVTNVSAVPCVRALDKGLQEIALYDGAGTRVWGSNDCFPEASSEPRTLAPGEVVSIPLIWGGLTSEPTCTAPRAAPAPGAYALVGRLDTKVTTNTPLTLG
jgi:hypothetical protein